MSQLLYYIGLAKNLQAVFIFFYSVVHSIKSCYYKRKMMCRPISSYGKQAPMKPKDNTNHEDIIPGYREHTRISNRGYYIFLIITVTAGIGIMAFLFTNLARNYQNNTAADSAYHLLEINHQIRTNVEMQLQKDDDFSQSLKIAAENTPFENEDSFFYYLRQQKNAAQAGQILIYTEDGNCYDQDGSAHPNHSGSFLSSVLAQGKASQIIDTTVEFGVSVHVDTEVHGSAVRILSVTHDLNTLFDSLNLQSYNGSGDCCLTRQNGVTVSRMNGTDMTQVYNLLSLFETGTINCLDESGCLLSDAMEQGEEHVFVFTGSDAVRRYVVATPLRFGMVSNWYVFYIVPVDVVNQSMNLFSSRLLLIAILIISFAAFMFLLFFLIYRKRSRMYESVLEERETELRRALSMANSANAAKTDFLSNVSHDIRTPLNAVINMTDFAIRDIENPERAKEYLQTARLSSAHLLQLINDVLDMSRIENGKLVFSSEPFRMDETLKSVCSIVEPLCIKKSQHFSFCTYDMKHNELTGDALRLKQILINILNNAVKYTPEGGTVSFEAAEMDSIKSRDIPFRFVITDNGIGIQKEHLDKIFEPFTRENDSRVSSVEGTGLGLSITNNIVKGMGGSIRAESEYGKGSVFTIELYFESNAAGTKPAPAQPEDMNLHFPGRKVLLAEDNDINLMIARTILESWEITVDSAADGAEAVRRFRESPEGSYDIIFLDIQMPVMDGYKAAAAIRSGTESDAGTIPIVAMTANVFADDIEHARQAGMNGHIGKPLDPVELHRITAKMMTKYNARKKETK